VEERGEVVVAVLAAADDAQEEVDLWLGWSSSLGEWGLAGEERERGKGVESARLSTRCKILTLEGENRSIRPSWAVEARATIALRAAGARSRRPGPTPAPPRRESRWLVLLIAC
jgi:hypothetical protein